LMLKQLFCRPQSDSKNQCVYLLNLENRDNLQNLHKEDIDKMKKVLIAMFAVFAFGMSISAQTVMVGGEAMFPLKNIVENAVNSKDHTTLVAAVKAAGLVDTLMSKGPFTVFAPTNDAFENLPEGTVATLIKPENKMTLTKILTYHVVAGKVTAKDLMKMIKAGGGKAMVKTVSGGMLTATMNGPMNVVIMDEKGNSANISTYDVMQSNGVIHVIDRVLLPN
jgi:uncharacterized surface protein with fasciclin (FAS1) repeats